MSIYLDERNPGKHAPFEDAAPDIVEYVRYLEVIAGKSANTAFSYYCDLRSFSRFMKRRRIVTPTPQGNLEANRHRHLRLISKRYRVVYYDDSDTLPHNAQVLQRKADRHGKLVKRQTLYDLLPIEKIENGILHTTDDRYIKILEIEPINFLLRSSEEQYNIISSFATWLKISPMKLQFKSVSRKADSDKHVAMVREELSREENQQCRQLGEEYLRLIKDVGNKEALSRRFFLIFQYEPPAGKRSSGESYADIYGMIQTAVQNAKTYFMQCGNAIVQPEDEDAFTAEMLYMFFNRSSCVNEPFQSRVERVVVDTMKAKGKIIGLDAVPHIRPANFIAPRGIDFSHYNFVVMDGMYYSCLLYTSPSPRD